MLNFIECIKYLSYFTDTMVYLVNSMTQTFFFLLQVKTLNDENLLNLPQIPQMLGRRVQI